MRKLSVKHVLLKVGSSLEPLSFPAAERLQLLVRISALFIGAGCWAMGWEHLSVMLSFCTAVVFSISSI